MLVIKMTSKNRVTLPRFVVERFPGVLYFDVRAERGRIVLRPVRLGAARDVRRKLAALNIRERDISAAVRSARNGPNALYCTLDLGPGGYARAPSRRAKQAVPEAIRDRARRR